MSIVCLILLILIVILIYAIFKRSNSFIGGGSNDKPPPPPLKFNPSSHAPSSVTSPPSPSKPPPPPLNINLSSAPPVTSIPPPSILPSKPLPLPPVKTNPSSPAPPPLIFKPSSTPPPLIFKPSPVPPVKANPSSPAPPPLIFNPSSTPPVKANPSSSTPPPVNVNPLSPAPPPLKLPIKSVTPQPFTSLPKSIPPSILPSKPLPPPLALLPSTSSSPPPLNFNPLSTPKTNTPILKSSSPEANLLSSSINVISPPLSVQKPQTPPFSQLHPPPLNIQKPKTTPTFSTTPPPLNIQKLKTTPTFSTRPPPLSAQRSQPLPSSSFTTRTPYRFSQSPPPPRNTLPIWQMPSTLHTVQDHKIFRNISDDPHFNEPWLINEHYSIPTSDSHILTRNKASEINRTGRFTFVSTNILVDAPIDLDNLVRVYNVAWERLHSEDYAHFQAKCASIKKEENRASELFMNLMFRTSALLIKESQNTIVQNIPPNPSLFIVGDIHGDIASLLLILRTYNRLLKVDSSVLLVFLGDYVDRGVASIDILIIICILKLKFPNRVFMCRGNHETSGAYWQFRDHDTIPTIITSIEERYGDIRRAYTSYVAFIVSLPYIIRSNDVLCLHGGISKTCLGKMLDMEPLRFRPVTELKNCIDCILWASYPNMGRSSLECPPLTPKDMSNMMSVNKLRLYVKGHDHVSANTQLHNANKDLYTLISSAYITRSSIPEATGVMHFDESEAENRTIPRYITDPKPIYKHMTTVLYVNRKDRSQNTIQIATFPETKKFANDLYLDITGYYMSLFGKVPNFYHDPKIRLNYASMLSIGLQPIITESDNIRTPMHSRTLDLLFDTLNVIEETNHQFAWV